MPLKCPICGKEYFYDRKICQICENISLYSGLIDNDEIKSQKWNCGIFLEFDTLAFGKHKPNDTYIKIASEPKFSDFKPKKEYVWNCDSKIKFRNFFTLKSGISQLRSIKKIPIPSSRILKEKINSSMMYE
ncbi:MAG: hypothetical protein ACFE91_14530 [Promethearchaeota archaeon]